MIMVISLRPTRDVYWEENEFYCPLKLIFVTALSPVYMVLGKSRTRHVQKRMQLNWQSMLFLTD